MEKFPIIITGKPVEREDKEELKEIVGKIIESWREEGKQSFPSEREKTEKEKNSIETSDVLLRMMFDRFKIPYDKKLVSPEQVHFFTKENFEKEFGNVPVDAGGFHRARQNTVCLKDGNENAPEGEKEIFDVSDVAHECIHLASKHKYQGVVGKDDSVTPGQYRVGYDMTTIENKKEISKFKGFNEIENKKAISKFRGFNEGVVCITQHFLFSDFSEELEKRTGITKEMRQMSHYSRYSQNQNIVFDIAEAIGKYRKESPMRSVYRIIKGQFTGEMAHLRDIDDIFGKGSLDLLAEYQSVSGTKDDRGRDELIAEYFQTDADDGDKREEIKQKIDELKEPVTEGK